MILVFSKLYLHLHQKRAVAGLECIAVSGRDGGHANGGLAKRTQAPEGQSRDIHEHIQAGDDEGDRRKDDGEQGESGDEFANEVELRHSDERQEPPEPGAAGVVGLTNASASRAVCVVHALCRHSRPAKESSMLCNDVHFRAKSGGGTMHGR
jgi:hypothetical protein